MQSGMPLITVRSNFLLEGRNSLRPLFFKRKKGTGLFPIFAANDYHYYFGGKKGLFCQ